MDYECKNVELLLRTGVEMNSKPAISKECLDQRLRDIACTGCNIRKLGGLAGRTGWSPGNSGLSAKDQ
jgi:hypothetical protein